MFSKPPGYVLATCVVSIAGILNGYDTGSIGAVTEMPYFTKTCGQLSPTLRGVTVSMIMLTGIPPSFFAGQLADRYGRLAIIMAGALIFMLGTTLQAAANGLPLFMAGRAFAGFGEGVWMGSLAVYVSEISPSARRGRLASTPQMMATAGICIGYFTCYASVHLDSTLSWRTTFIAQTASAAILAVSCLFLPESPRWLLLNGRREQAIRGLKRLDFSTVEAEKDLLGPAAGQQEQRQQRPGPIKGFTMIFQKQYRSRTVLGFFTLGMIQMSGIDGVLYYAPTLFAQAGLPPTSASFLASGLSAILMLAVSVPALFYADRFTRRSVVLVGGLLLTTCMLLIGSLYASNSVSSTGPARWVVIILVFVFGLTYSSTWGIVGKIYASEIQPSATRSAANSAAQGLGFFTNWLVAILTPVLLANSRFAAYFVFGGFCLTTMLVLWSYMPETRGQSLEAIEEAFRQPLSASGRIANLLRHFTGTARASSQSSSSATSSAETSSHTSLPDMSAHSGESIEMSGALHTGETSDSSALDTGIRMTSRVEMMI